MADKCFWCSKESPELTKTQIEFRGKSEEISICGASCEKELRNFARYAESHIKHYLVGLALAIVAGLFLTFWRIKIDYGALGVFTIFAGSGLVLIKFPFVTPQTVASLGAKRAISTGRVLGAISIVLGIVSWFVLTKIIA